MDESTKKLVWEWYLSGQALTEAKQREDALRTAVLTAVFGDALQEGTTTREISEGVAIKAKQNYTRAIDENALPDALLQLGAIGEMVVTRKHSLNKKVYDSLPDSHRAIMDCAVITKPGKPALELIMKAGE
jgi:hypothetical protein